MLSDIDLEVLAQRLPAKAPYAVVGSLGDLEEDENLFEDSEHIYYCQDLEEAEFNKQIIESFGYEAYIIRPKAPYSAAES